MDTWHPKQIAQPSEWELRNGWPPDPIGVVKRLELGPLHEVWFRAVTWALVADERHLIGYTKTFESACEAVWEHNLAAVTAHRDPRPNGR